MIRTFIALDLPSDVLAALAATQTQVRDHLAAQQLERALRWSLTKNLHLTLRFLGDTSAAQAAEMTTRLLEVAGKSAPFVLEVDNSGRALGGFPDLRQPRVLWMGVGGDLVALRHLQSEIEMVAQAVGFAAELQHYSPHLTLARAGREVERRTLTQVGRAIASLMHTAPPASPLRFTVDHVTFYQSELQPGGPRYTRLVDARLAGT